MIILTFGFLEVPITNISNISNQKSALGHEQ